MDKSPTTSPMTSHCTLGAPDVQESKLECSPSTPVCQFKSDISPRYIRSSKLSEYMQASASTSSAPSRDWPTNADRSLSTLSLKSDSPDFFCDWFPILFGIDEDDIPSIEEYDEFEGEFEEMPTASQLEMLRVDSKENLPDEELIKIWRDRRQPKYGRRARPKPILQKDDGTYYECLCKTDENFERHYVPNFGGANPEEKDNWRTPHFVLYWQDLRDREAGKADDDAWLEELQFGKLKPDATEEKIPYVRPTPKFEIGKKNQKGLRERTLASLKPLDCREIRRFRLPYAEALLLELQEDGYVDTASFFNDLIFDEECPHDFKNNQSIVYKLVNALKECERRGRKNERNKQAVIYIKLAKFFEDDKKYWGLSMALYQKAVEASDGFLLDGGRSEAVARFAYGIFLLNNLDEFEQARDQLSKARELSQEKDWNASTILNTPQDSVYKECSTQLCRALLANGRQLRDQDKGDEALSLIHQAHKLVEESKISRTDLKADSIYELGVTYQKVGMLDWAKTAFRKFLSVVKAEGNKKRICDGLLQLAVCYRSEGNMEECEDTLKSLLEASDASGDKVLQAFANRFFGEFNLNRGHTKASAIQLERAFNLFNEAHNELPNKPWEQWTQEDKNLVKDLELTRCLVGVAKGQLVMRSVFQLILDADHDKEAMAKLLAFKNGDPVDLEEDHFHIPKQKKEGEDDDDDDEEFYDLAQSMLLESDTEGENEPEDSPEEEDEEQTEESILTN